MICNILAIIIFLLIIFIIALIVSKNKETNTNETLVQHICNTKSNSNIILGKTQDELAECFTVQDDIRTINTINNNNNRIIQLINDINSNNIPVKLINYDPNILAKDYTTNVTSNIALLDRAIKTMNVDNLVKQQKIDKLQKNLVDLEKLVNNMENNKVFTKKYTSIKSLNNGMELGLVNTPNTIFNDPKSNSKIPAYLVGVNDGCLSVGTSDYDIYKCDDKNPKQYFKMEHILNPLAYGKNIDSALPITNVNLNTINYPFIMLKSVNNDNCLTNYHGNLTVQPCYTYESQRWFPLETR